MSGGVGWSVHVTRFVAMRQPLLGRAVSAQSAGSIEDEETLDVNILWGQEILPLEILGNELSEQYRKTF